MKNYTLCILTIICAFAISGCATTASLDDTRAKDPERVKSDVLNCTLAEADEAAKESIINLGLMLSREGKKDNSTVLYAKSGTNLAKIAIYRSGFGEMVAIYLTPLSESETKVEVVIQKSNQLEIGYKDYRELVIKQIKLVLAVNKASLNKT